MTNGLVGTGSSGFWAVTGNGFAAPGGNGFGAAAGNGWAAGSHGFAATENWPAASSLLSGMYVSYWLPTVVLTAALAIKLPSILKLWRDPLLRAVGGLLVFACAVFVFAAPRTIAWTNRVTGVPNIAAPWVYSLLTALSASWLLLIIAWRNGGTERSAQTRRATRWVVSVYAAVVVALWVLFALADVPLEQIQDYDTYYAGTPFAREGILLYLLAHTVACSVTARLIWNWIRTDGLDAWLRWGLRFLGVGYATNLLFSAAKLTAVVARWTGYDLDWLNTNLAPSAACIAATFVAIGFIVPHAGQYLQERWLVRRRHRSLRPLARLMRNVTGSREPLALRATPEMRLIRRETFIRDALLQLSRHLDEDLRGRAYDAALALGHDRGRAQALAAAVTILDAVATGRRAAEAEGAGGAASGVPAGPDAPAEPDTTYLLREIQAVSEVLRRPDDITAVRARAAAPAESVSTHD
ncbi:Integral membrane protein OS=Streptomyces aurantiogriseus OX=66870 GN=GCM10010251_39810 PE=4 SV=1 [Streptomyces aurantiogriseus]